ncbi:hypothetical protein TNCT_404421 [Trichonephila clavata]|uniref:Uncharacterized protein n=1 Tax=Trichonephila clavata TaxID=2740835 RepID=A0A8X6LU86_TRICU|nr:hypothetical protein TNCT_404421 [Trichonephila clavata]
MEWFQQCMSLTQQYNASTCGQQDTFSEQKMHPSTTKQWFKLSMNIWDFDEQHGLPYDKRSLRLRHPYSFGNDTEKSIVLPLSRHRGFRFQQSSTRHVSLNYKACFKPVNGPPKTFQDAMDPLRNKNCPGRSSKSPYTKAGPLLGSQCPDLISRGNLFEPSCHVFIIQQSCVLMCHWTTEDLSG